MYQYRLFSCSSCEALVRPLISVNKTKQNKNHTGNKQDGKHQIFFFNETLLNTVIKGIFSPSNVEKVKSRLDK